jgi:hypothetical protein
LKWIIGANGTLGANGTYRATEQIRKFRRTGIRVQPLKHQYVRHRFVSSFFIYFFVGFPAMLKSMGTAKPR